MISSGLLIQGISHLGILVGILFEAGSIMLFFFYLYHFGYTISFGGVLPVYQAEILSGDLVPATTSITWILALIISLFILSITKAVGLFAVLLFCALVCLFIWVWFQGYGVETKGKTRIQIEDEFNSRVFLG